VIEVQEYKHTKPRGGKRVVRVEKDGEIIFPVATYKMLTELLHFTASDRKKITAVLAGDRPTVKGYRLHNLGWLVQ